MKIILYSKLSPETNLEMQERLNRHLTEWLGSRPVRIAYPLYRTDALAYVEKAEAFYLSLGLDFTMVVIDLERDPAIGGTLEDCDALHLSGGDTFEFMRAIRARAFGPEISAFCHSGRPVVAVSAGALLLAPSIGSAVFGDPEETIGDDTEALDIIGFELFPHWNLWSHYLDPLLEYSRSIRHGIIVVSDGEGVAIDGEDVLIHGPTLRVRGGDILTNI